MARLRENPPQELGGQSVTAYADYRSGEIKDGNGLRAIDFPREDALRFALEKGWVCVRPSGTEPKVKLYMAVCGKTKEETERLMAALGEDAKAMIG